MKPLRVMLVDENPERARVLEEVLVCAGYTVAVKITGRADLAAQVSRVRPDVILIDMDSPDRDTLEAMHTLAREQPTPVVMFVDQSDSESIQRAVRAGVSGYIVGGVSAERVKPIMEVAIARFREFQSLKDELERTKSTLAARKTIEKAKGILMKRRGMSEDDAYQALRKMAMDRNQRLEEVAINVISISEFL